VGVCTSRLSVAAKHDVKVCIFACRAAYSSPDHRLAHAACACYDNDDEVQYSSAEAGSAGVPESWAAVQPMRRRLNYLVSSPTQERKVPLAVQKYMSKAAGTPPSTWHVKWSVQ